MDPRKEHEKAHRRSLVHAVHLVLALHDHPETNAPGYLVRLDPQAEKQLREAVAETCPECGAPVEYTRVYGPVCSVGTQPVDPNPPGLQPIDKGCCARGMTTCSVCGKDCERTPGEPSSVCEDCWPDPDNGV